MKKAVVGVLGAVGEGGVSEAQGPGRPAELGIICFSGGNTN